MTKEQLALLETEEGIAPLSYGLRTHPCPKPWDAPEAVREHFRRTHASLRRGRKNFMAIGVCSLNQGEGTSYVASKLACAAAEAEAPVFLLDANRRRPSQEHIFGFGTQSGVGASSIAIENMTVRSTSWPNLSVVFPRDLAAGDGSSGEILGALNSIGSLSGMAFVDCEPLRDSSQAVRLAPGLDGVLFVVQAERERREAIADAVAQLKRAEIPVLGLIVNKQRRYLPALLYRALQSVGL
jgi:Mrp family chromosome partitioning ATPase